jgi:hypothetical protein
MNTELNKQQDKLVETSVSSNREYLNFELWATEVRRQMLALLEKKGSEREAKSNRKKWQQG